jgi:hypothetical protein
MPLLCLIEKGNQQKASALFQAISAALKENLKPVSCFSRLDKNLKEQY